MLWHEEHSCSEEVVGRQLLEAGQQDQWLLEELVQHCVQHCCDHVATIEIVAVGFTITREESSKLNCKRIHAMISFTVIQSLSKYYIYSCYEIFCHFLSVSWQRCHVISYNKLNAIKTIFCPAGCNSLPIKNMYFSFLCVCYICLVGWNLCRSMFVVFSLKSTR
jgi:hypothetical protein